VPQPDSQQTLEQQIIETIRQDGPLPLDRYMNLCLAHPEHGYYMSRDPFGRGGDFTTAPEISQMFGELIGIWCVSSWQTLQAPDPFHLVELGPGRGTLMADLLRAAKVMPGFHDSVRVHMVETSPVLRALQEKTLAATGLSTTWHHDISSLPQEPTIFIGNEFFDALPVQQIQKSEAGWHERVVGLGEDAKLQVGLASDRVPEAIVPDWARDGEAGDITEFSPARADYAMHLAKHVAECGGAMLLIDYGHTRPGTGDTLQAVSQHNPVDILHEPGECDLTAHVDFAALEACFKDAGLATYGPVTQSRFLAGMGIAERMEMLTKRGGARERMKIAEAARRLVAGTEMGHLFKVLIATHKDMPAPQPFAQMEKEAKR